MWSGKLGSGMIAPCDLARAPEKTHCFYQALDLDSLKALRGLMQSYATKAGAMYRQQTIYGYTPAGAALYLLRVEVIRQGGERGRRGRR